MNGRIKLISAIGGALLAMPMALHGAAAQEYKIGLVSSQTGPGAFIGDPFLKGAKMAVDRANAAGGINGKKIQLIAYDSEASADKTLVFVKKLINDDKVAVMLGPDFSGTVRASLPTIEEAKIVSLYDTPIIEPKPGSFHFTPWPSEETGYRVALKSLQARGVKKMAIIATTDYSGQSGFNWVKKLHAEYGIEVVATERMEMADKDVTAQLTKIKAARPDAVFEIGSGAIVAVVCKAYVRLGFTQPLMLSTGAVSGTFPSLLKGITPDTLIFATYNLLVVDTLPASNPSKKPIQDYLKLYKATYGKEGDQYGGSGWDLALIAIDAMRKVGTDRVKIRDYIQTVRNFPGTMAPITFTPQNHRGTADDAFIMAQFKDGKFLLTK
ncbi:MAG: ABC transporter substrate-binding protein [Rhodospirillaceae bacterium]|nr:ABC transporter substrate-binding protein [Rhodospirillaceae bacterium]